MDKYTIYFEGLVTKTASAFNVSDDCARERLQRQFDLAWGLRKKKLTKLRSHFHFKKPSIEKFYFETAKKLKTDGHI